VTRVKRRALALILIIIIALSVASWIVYNQINTLQNQISELKAQNSELQEQNLGLQDQNSELQNQLNNLQEAIGNVEIAALSVEGWYNPVGVMYVKPFNVTIQNNGTHDAYGVTLNCKITGNQNNLFYNFYYAEPPTKTLDVIHVGESRMMRVFIETSLELASQFSGCNLVATLMFSDIVLDEWTQVI
jgi:regulator of replication initiation timing